MRTLFYYTAREYGGSARAFATAARGLAARGEPVTIACRAGTPAEQSFARCGVDVVALPDGAALGRDTWRLRAVLKERFVEVVFLHTEREHLTASSALRLAERGAVVRRVPAGLAVGGGRRGAMADRMASSRYLFTTEADRARSRVAERAFVAPLGVDVGASRRVEARAALGIDEGAQLIVCVTDESSRTRLKTALRTLALLAERHPALRLALVGALGNDDDTHMHAAALGVTPLVRFLGRRDDLPLVLAAADVGWVAAEGDDGAFACLDLMAAAVPVIAERSPLIAHYVPDGIAGVLLPPADPSDTASAVASFLSNEQQRAGMGRAGRTRVQRDFGEEALIDGFATAAVVAGDRSVWAVR